MAGVSLAVPFNPTPRIYAPFVPVELECPAPPTKPSRPPIPWLSALVPLVAGAGIAAVTHSMLLLAFMLLSPILLFTSAHESRRQQAKEHAEAVAEFTDAVDEVLARQRTHQADERRARHEGSPAVDVVAAWASARDRRIWERGPRHGDVLNLRIGTADQPTAVTVVLGPGGSVGDRRRLQARIASNLELAGLPVEVPLLDVGHVGVSGGEVASGLARALVAQAAALHSPAVLTIAAIVDGGNARGWEWLKWLPHTRAGSGPSLAGDRLCVHPDDATRLVERLTDLVRRRLDAAHGRPFVPATRVLLLVDGACSIDPSRLAELYDRGPDAGVHVIFVSASPNAVPRSCGAVVVAGATAEMSRVAFSGDGRVVRGVSLETLTARTAGAVSRSLGPLVDSSAPADDDSDLPDRVSLVEILGGAGIMAPSVIVERWSESRGLTAVVGAMAGEPLRLDMCSDGPHALVAGTTGAGKSELLQTLIAALALSHSPTRVNFLLIDYKGGAAFKECRDLPHTVGMVTDLNAQEVRRALVSLDAEITRREQILALAGAKDLDDLRALDGPDTPASLFIVVDEFAALVKEVPEFVAGIVDLASRGRSLGMHLVLATQRPAGVISDSIRANTDLRIALRVADEDDSTDVIGEPIAAHISRSAPGRGVYRSGPKETRVFQTGYVGGRTMVERPQVEVRVRPFGLGEGQAACPVSSKLPGGDASAGPTDLQKIVSGTSRAAEDLGLPEPHQPWLDPLPVVLDLPTLVSGSSYVEGCVVVGLLDDPEHQRRVDAGIDLARNGSVLVIGAGGSGKTAFLRTVAASIGLQAEEPMDVYALDFVGRGLTMLSQLPLVGQVIGADEGERLVRLFDSLRSTISRRVELFAAEGVADLAAYRERTGQSEESRIVVLLDGLQAFEAAYERVDRGAIVDALPRLIGEGRAAGVHFVITADRRASVRSAIFGLINTVVALRQSSGDELANLNLRPDAIASDAPPGRCFLSGLEGQIALLGSPEGEGQATAMAALATAPAPTTHRRAPSVPLLPIEVWRADLRSDAVHLQPGETIIGLDSCLLTPVVVDLLHDHLCVLGRRRSGRTTALAALAAGLEQPSGATLILVTPRSSPLRSTAPWHQVVVGVDDAMDLLTDLGEHRTAGEPVVLFIDDLAELGDRFDSALVDVLVNCRDRLRVVATAETRHAITSYAGSVLGELRQVQRGLILQPNLPEHEDLFTVRLSASSTLRFPPGRGFLVEGDQSSVVQVVAG